MTFTFHNDLSDDLSRVRQYLGDTDQASALVQDETIEAYLKTRSELATAAQLARDIAAQYARQIDNTADGASQRAAQLYDHFRSLADDLQRQAAEQTQAATSGGFSGLGVFGATAQEVYDARDDCTAARNARSRWD